jgi:hypothetical protein
MYMGQERNFRIISHPQQVLINQITIYISPAFL